MDILSKSITQTEFNQTISEKEITENKNKVKIKNLVLSGGGINGIAHIGALFALSELGYLNKIETFAGTSVGSLIISLYILGYEPAELYDFIKLFDLSKLKNLSIMNIHLFGLDTGSKMEYVIKRLIQGKGFDENIKLKELFDLKKKKLIFTTVCINTMEIYYISHETHPDLPLYLAIRMSISIPFIYCPIHYKEHLFIDGGCLDNYPISVFKHEKENTIGILLTDSKNKIDKIENLETYILRVLQCIMEGMAFNCKKGFENSTIDIEVESISLTNYDIGDEKKDTLFMKGYNTIIINKKKFC